MAAAFLIKEADDRDLRLFTKKKTEKEPSLFSKIVKVSRKKSKFVSGLR